MTYYETCCPKCSYLNIREYLIDPVCDACKTGYDIDNVWFELKDHEVEVIHDDSREFFVRRGRE